MAILRYNAKVYEDTAAKLATDQTVYQHNEFIFATDTGEMKRGNGVDVYADLEGIKSSTEVTADRDSGLAAADDIQDLAVQLSTRIKALEDAVA